MRHNLTARAVSFGTFLLVVGAAQPAAQTPTYFETPISSGAGDPRTLFQFQTPAGTGTNRTMAARIVTSNPSPEVEVFPAGGNSTRNVVDITPTPVISCQAITEPGTGNDVAPSVCAQTIVTGNDAPATGYTMIRVTMQYADAYNFAAGGETWRLKVFDAATAYDYFGFFGTTDAQVTKDTVKLPASVDFGDVQQGVPSTSVVAPVKAVDIQNVGTAAFGFSQAPISNDVPLPSVFSHPAVVVGTLRPGGSVTNDWTLPTGLWIMANPQTLGGRTATLTVQGSSGSATTTNLLVHGVSLYAHFLMDVSVSMAGSPTCYWCTTPEFQSRLWLAKEAGKEINSWISDFSGGNAYIGLTTFPAPGPNGTTDGQVIVPIDRAQNSWAGIQAAFQPIAVGGLQPRDATPMEAGIIAARGDMEARIMDASKPPSPSDVPNLRQAILLMTDGMQNVGSALNQLGPLNTDGVRVYTVGFGIGDGEVDQTVLQDLASGTGGQFFDANVLTTKFALKNAFKSAVTPWLGLQPVTDPEGTIRAGQSISHDVCVDSSARGVSVVVDWDSQVPHGIHVQLRTPKGETITPTSANIAYHTGGTFAMYAIRGNRLRGGQGAGLWTLALTGDNALPSATDTKYSYSLLVETPVFPDIPVQGPLPGVQFLYEVGLRGVNPATRHKASVMLRYSAPGRSFNTYLATNAIDPSWVLRRLPDSVQRRTAAARKSQFVPDTFGISLRTRKAYALAHFAGKPFVDTRVADSLLLYDDGTHGDRVAGDGVFSAELPVFRFDGVYRFNIGIAAGGLVHQGCFQRDIRVAQYVPVHLTPSGLGQQVSIIGVDSSVFFDTAIWKAVSGVPPTGFQRKVVRLAPRDDQGNYWGPGFARQVQFRLTGAEPFGDVVDNWDGTYLQVVQYRTGTHPQVSVSAGGMTSPPVPLIHGPPLPWWLIALILLILAALVWVLVTRRRVA